MVRVTTGKYPVSPQHLLPQAQLLQAAHLRSTSEMSAHPFHGH